MRSKSVPELAKLNFGQIACFVAPANENHICCIPKSSKLVKNQAKTQTTHGLEKKKASMVDFWRFSMIFGVLREGRKSPKIEKRRPKNRSKKRTKKKRRSPPSEVECGGLRAAQGIQDSTQEGSCQDCDGV